MAALSANTERRRKSLHNAEIDRYAVQTSEIVYEGSLVSILETGPRLKAAAAAASETFVGVR